MLEKGREKEKNNENVFRSALLLYWKGKERKRGAVKVYPRAMGVYLFLRGATRKDDWMAGWLDGINGSRKFGGQDKVTKLETRYV